MCAKIVRSHYSTTMKNKYTYTDHAPIFVARQRLLGGMAKLLYGAAAAKVRIIAVTGKAGGTDTCTFLEYSAKKAGSSIAIVSEKGAVVIREGIVVWRKDYKYYGEMSPLFLGKVCARAYKEQVQDVFIESNSWHLVSGTFAWIPFDGVLTTYFSLKDVPTDQEEEDFFIASKYLLNRLAYMPRKNGIEKVLYYNEDDFYREETKAVVVDQQFSFSVGKAATLHLQQWKSKEGVGEGKIHIPNAVLPLRTNRTDRVGVAVQLGVFVYLMSANLLKKTLTADVAFTMPNTVFVEAPHLVDLPMDDMRSMVADLHEGALASMSIVVLVDRLSEKEGRVIQSLLHDGATVLLWTKQAKQPKKIMRMLVNTYTQQEVALFVFTRPQELYLKAKLLQKDTTLVVLAPKKEIVEAFSIKARP